MVSEFGYCSSSRSTPERRISGEQFIVEDLLDFSNDDGVILQEDNPVIFEEGGMNNSNNSNSSDSSSLVVTPPGEVRRCLHCVRYTMRGIISDNSSFSGSIEGGLPGVGENGTHFSGELCVPIDDLAELEWFSNFMEESFSSEDLQKFHLASGMSSAMKTRPDTIGPSETRYYKAELSRSEIAPNPTFNPEMAVPGKARSKRSRAAPCNWTSRLIILSDGSPDLSTLQTQSEPILVPKPIKAASKKKGPSGSGVGLGSGSGSSSDMPNGEVRRCLHCATHKTPQWRTGPMGPKTLCNACGVRYKSGRLVPEYRPAASPTFVQTKHSNSHRKVMELRRQKDLMRNNNQPHIQHYHHHQQLIHHSSNYPSNNNMLFDPKNTDDYLIHQHIGPDFRQLI